MVHVTIIVPVYNVCKYLDRCLESIVNQTMKEYDVVLIDDGSTDGSGEICDRYAKCYPFIQVIHQSNCGLSVARNVGIEWALNYSDSQYLTFIDSDDWVHPQYLERLYTAVQEYGCGVIVGKFIKTSEEIEFIIDGYPKFSVVSPSELYCDNVANFIVAWGKLYRKSDFSVLRFPEGKIYEDEFTIWKILFKYDQVVVINQPLYVYFQREDSIINSEWNTKRLARLDAMEEQRIWFDEHGDKFLKQRVRQRLVDGCAEQICAMKSIGADRKTIRRYVSRLKGYIRDANPKLSFGKYSYAYRIAWPIASILTIVIWKVGRRVNNFIKQLKRFFNYKRRKSGLSKELNSLEYTKYWDYLKEDTNRNTLIMQMEEFFCRSLNCMSMKAEFSDNPEIPTVVCVVKNEISRMQLFYEHYRRLGVTQFAILDNDSTDGTCEYLLKQPDTHVYSIKEKFETQKKTAWIEKMLVLEGYNKWYIVVDSDELLDYSGSENHTITEYIRCLNENGYRRALGLMLDMYSKEKLFSVECDPLDVPKLMSYFDYDSYMKLQNKDNVIIGGPRYRVFGTEMWLSKQAVFYFSPDVLYRNCHFILPQIGRDDAPFNYVLRHYKFLKTDENVYKQRIEEKNFFNGSIEYSQQMDAIEQGRDLLYYEKTIHYDNSYSLLKIPYLKEIKW